MRNIERVFVRNSEFSWELPYIHTMRNGKTAEILTSLFWDSHKILWGISYGWGSFLEIYCMYKTQVLKYMYNYKFTPKIYTEEVASGCMVVFPFYNYIGWDMIKGVTRAVMFSVFFLFSELSFVHQNHFHWEWTEILLHGTYFLGCGRREDFLCWQEHKWLTGTLLRTTLPNRGL